MTYAREVTVIETDSQILELGFSASGHIDLIVHRANDSGSFEDMTARLSQEDVRRLRAALTPQTGSAGEDPKTPDAGVGEAPDLDAISAEFERRYAAVPEAARRFASDTWGEAWSHAEMGSLLDFAALAQPAPAGEDETGVREALVKADLQIGDGHIEAARRTLHAAMDALAPQPPKAETPAGVGETTHERLMLALESAGMVYRDMKGAIYNGRRHDTDLTNTIKAVASWLDMPAALSAAPAARPGDGVERVTISTDMEGAALDAFYGSRDWRVPKRTKQYEKDTRRSMRLALQAVLELAAAPAADGGRA